jgi:hypothetical protein
MSLVSLFRKAEEATPDEVPEGHGLMQYMSDEGDTRVIWDPDNPDEVDAARAQFNSLTKKGYQAYRVRRGGEKGERVREFDPTMERIILAPATVGG